MRIFVVYILALWKVFSYQLEYDFLLKSVSVIERYISICKTNHSSVDVYEVKRSILLSIDFSLEDVQSLVQMSVDFRVSCDFSSPEMFASIVALSGEFDRALSQQSFIGDLVFLLDSSQSDVPPVRDLVDVFQSMECLDVASKRLLHLQFSMETGHPLRVLVVLSGMWSLVVESCSETSVAEFRKAIVDLVKHFASDIDFLSKMSSWNLLRHNGFEYLDQRSQVNLPIIEHLISLGKNTSNYEVRGVHTHVLGLKFLILFAPSFPEVWDEAVLRTRRSLIHELYALGYFAKNRLPIERDDLDLWSRASRLNACSRRLMSGFAREISSAGDALIRESRHLVSVIFIAYFKTSATLRSPFGVGRRPKPSQITAAAHLREALRRHHSVFLYVKRLFGNLNSREAKLLFSVDDCAKAMERVSTRLVLTERGLWALLASAENAAEAARQLKSQSRGSFGKSLTVEARMLLTKRDIFNTGRMKMQLSEIGELLKYSMRYEIIYSRCVSLQSSDDPLTTSERQVKLLSSIVEKFQSIDFPQQCTDQLDAEIDRLLLDRISSLMCCV